MYQRRGWSQVEENAFTWLHATVQSWSPLIKWLHHLIKFIWDLLSSRNYVSSLFKLLLEMPLTPFFTFVQSNSCYLTGVQGCNLHIRSLCTECAVNTLISKVKAPYLSDRAFWCCLFGMTLSMNQLEELMLILLMTTPRPTESVSFRLATLLYIQTTQEWRTPRVWVLSRWMRWWTVYQGQFIYLHTWRSAEGRCRQCVSRATHSSLHPFDVRKTSHLHLTRRFITVKENVTFFREADRTFVAVSIVVLVNMTNDAMISSMKIN